jgi:Flp pilus assembly protein TadD
MDQIEKRLSSSTVVPTTPSPAKATRNLGFLLDARGDPEAERWWRQAAEAGDSVARVNLVLLLSRRDDPEVERWLE